MDINNLVLEGCLGNDPVDTTSMGVISCLFKIANRKSFNNEKGEIVNLINWFNVQCFDKNALNALSYLEKGRRIIIEGELSVKSNSFYVIAKKIRYIPNSNKN